MTNKINGIDVSECSYYNKDNEPYCCEVWDNECEAQNCYFKQLKRSQEENEEFIKVIDCKNGTIATLNEEIANLKRNYRVSCLRCEYKNTKADVDKYKQALEEIRSYCDEQNLKADYTACYITNRIDEVLKCQ